MVLGLVVRLHSLNTAVQVDIEYVTHKSHPESAFSFICIPPTYRPTLYHSIQIKSNICQHITEDDVFNLRL